MKLAKWGNSFAFRVPAELIRKMNLTPDEDFQFRQTGEDSFEIIRDRRRQEALEAIRRLAKPLPPGYKFNREEIHEREWMRRMDKEREMAE
ncbi:MAG: AbrB/MazE/SpoVT family DNA-binding domain-containing protein [Terracidiphilus sp.]|jgi:antitoxin MazE